MHLLDYPDCYSTFIDMVHPVEVDDALSKTNLTILTRSTALIYSEDTVSHNPSRDCFMAKLGCNQNDERDPNDPNNFVCDINYKHAHVKANNQHNLDVEQEQLNQDRCNL